MVDGVCCAILYSEKYGKKFWPSYGGYCIKQFNLESLKLAGINR